MPPSKDWGRRAVGKFDKRLEDDELFKEIGGQLDASNFDYSQWQRTGKASKAQPQQTESPETSKPRSAPPGPSKKTTVDPKPGFLVSIPVKQPAVVTKGATDKKPVCCHHQIKRDKRQTVSKAYVEALAKKKAEEIKILQLRVRARKQTIAEYRKRQAELLLANMELRDTVIDMEKEAHEEVKKLLRQYEKYRGGINTLNDRFVDDLAEARSAYEETKLKVDTGLQSLEKEVNDMDEKLQEKLTEMNVLTNYKDKEYPVKALRISELQSEISELNVKQQTEEGELEHIIDTELEKFRKQDDHIKDDVREAATQEAMKKMHPSLKDMAMQNIVMVKEMEFHEQEINRLSDANAQLESEVEAMARDPKSHLRRVVYPEFYPNTEKCTPDMEVVLDIPTQNWLPI